jgi:hypothetical protein
MQSAALRARRVSIVQFGDRLSIPAQLASREGERPTPRPEAGPLAGEPQAWSIGGKLAAAVIRFASGARSPAASANECY